MEEFLVGTTAEARTLRDAATLLNGYGVPTQAKGQAWPILDKIVAELRDERYDLLVVGAQRVASTLNRLLLKDMTSDLVESSPQPVVVVKGTRGR